MASAADDETAAGDQGKGPLVYHESKVFNTEWFLCNVFDNSKRRRVTFEVYGLDTQEILHLPYNYQEFDALFRFNAALMNPNRKEGRFHWIIERLTIVSVGKERKLQLGPAPTPEVPELPIYETERKIPTGRMDFKERQRLREQMDVLDVRRAENISLKRSRGREQFLRHIAELKEQDVARKRELEERIAQERQERYKAKEDQDRQDAELRRLAEERAKARLKAAEGREQRIQERQEEEYRQLRLRWKLRDEERRHAVDEGLEHHRRELAARREAELQLRRRLEEAQARRLQVWKARDDRIRRRGADTIRKIQEVKLERQRLKKMQRERNLEYIKLLHDDRQPIFAAQLRRTEQRRAAQEAEAQAVAAYVEQRTMPKKVKLKGKNAKKEPMVSKDGKDAAKEGKESAKEGKDTKSGKESKAKKDKEAKEVAKEKEVDKERESTERVLDAVEAKMRAEMEEQKRREQLATVRDAKIAERERRWQASEVARAKAVREAHRQKELQQAQQAAERKLVMRQRDEERKAAEERRRLEQERLQRVRDQNVARKEQQRLAALAA